MENNERDIFAEAWELLKRRRLAKETNAVVTGFRIVRIEGSKEKDT